MKEVSHPRKLIPMRFVRTNTDRSQVPRYLHKLGRTPVDATRSTHNSNCLYNGGCNHRLANDVSSCRAGGATCLTWRS